MGWQAMRFNSKHLVEFVQMWGLFAPNVLSKGKDLCINTDRISALTLP